MTGKETVDIMTKRVESCCGNFYYKNDVFIKGENLYSTSGDRFLRNFHIVWFFKVGQRKHVFGAYFNGFDY